MKREELSAQAERIAALFDAIGKEQSEAYTAAHSQAAEFLRRFAAPDSEFLAELKAVNRYFSDLAAGEAAGILRSFRVFVDQGLHQGRSPEEEAKLEVVGDFLEQARLLLAETKVHPAAAVVVAGATLEEFLRNWAAKEGVLPAGTPTLSVLASALRGKASIAKQDEKDITSWAGLRNDAAHGNWAAVDDRNRARLMVEGIALFMRKYS